MLAGKIALIVKEFEGNNKSSFARKIGIPQGRTGLVHDWISGTAAPKKAYQEKICNAYKEKGVTMAWLNTWEDVPTLPSISIVSAASVPGVAGGEHIPAEVSQWLNYLTMVQQGHNERMSEQQRITQTLADANVKMADAHREIAKSINETNKTVEKVGGTVAKAINEATEQMSFIKDLLKCNGEK